MSSEYFPTISATIADIPTAFGYPIQRPVVYHVAAPAMDKGSGWSTQAQYHAPRGELHGKSNPNLTDTTLSTGSNTGTVFNPVQGTWYEGCVAPGTYTKGIVKPDSTAGATWEAVQAQTYTSIQNATIVLFLGWAGPGNGAVGVANLTGSAVSSVSVTNGGTGYPASSTFNITFDNTGSGGSGATATATTDSSGAITSCAVTAGGSSYTSSPTVVFPTGSGASGLVQLNADKVGFIVLLSGGSNYPPSSTFNVGLTGNGTGATATATTNATGVVTQFTVTAGGSGYTSSPTLSASFAQGQDDDSNVAYLHFCYGNDASNPADYRLVFQRYTPIRLQYAPDGVTFNDVSNNQYGSSLDQLLQTGDNLITLRVHANYGTNAFDIEINDGKYAVHAPGVDQTTGDTIGLPQFGCVRFWGMSRAVGMHYWPAAYEPIVANSPNFQFSAPLINAPSAFIVSNGTASPPSDQQTFYTINTADNQNFNYQIGASSATDTPIIGDAMFCAPAAWTTVIPGATNQFGPMSLRSIMVEETEYIDQITRTGGIHGKIWVSNYDQLYSGSYGDIAIEIDVSNNITWDTRCTGVAGHGEGVGFERADPITGLMTLPFQDKSRQLQEPLGQEIILDGWPLYNAVLFLLELGGIDWQGAATGTSQVSDFIQSYYYIPPGTTSDAPYGPSGADLPDGFYSLPQGTGLNPRYRFTPEITMWQVLLQLVSDMSATDPTTGLDVSFYMWFDAYGIFHFEPVFFAEQLPTWQYSDNDPTGLGQISNLRIYNSVESMRTEIILQGLDAQTNELLNYPLGLNPDDPNSLDPNTIVTKGWHSILIERNSRWCTWEFLQQAAVAYQFQAQLPQQIAVWDAPFQPTVHAGDVVLLTESNLIGGTYLYRIDEIRSRYGYDPYGQTGQVMCHSTITARPLINAI